MSDERWFRLLDTLMIDQYAFWDNSGIRILDSAPVDIANCEPSHWTPQGKLIVSWILEETGTIVATLWKPEWEVQLPWFAKRKTFVQLESKNQKSMYNEGAKIAASNMHSFVNKVVRCIPSKFTKQVLEQLDVVTCPSDLAIRSELWLALAFLVQQTEASWNLESSDSAKKITYGSKKFDQNNNSNNDNNEEIEFHSHNTDQSSDNDESDNENEEKEENEKKEEEKYDENEAIGKDQNGTEKEKEKEKQVENEDEDPDDDDEDDDDQDADEDDEDEENEKINANYTEWNDEDEELKEQFPQQNEYLRQDAYMHLEQAPSDSEYYNRFVSRVLACAYQWAKKRKAKDKKRATRVRNECVRLWYEWINQGAWRTILRFPLQWKPLAYRHSEEVAYSYYTCFPERHYSGPVFSIHVDNNTTSPSQALLEPRLLPSLAIERAGEHEPTKQFQEWVNIQEKDPILIWNVFGEGLKRIQPNGCPFPRVTFPFRPVITYDDDDDDEEEEIEDDDEREVVEMLNAITFQQKDDSFWGGDDGTSYDEDNCIVPMRSRGFVIVKGRMFAIHPETGIFQPVEGVWDKWPLQLIGGAGELETQFRLHLLHISTNEMDMIAKNTQQWSSEFVSRITRACELRLENDEKNEENQEDADEFQSFLLFGQNPIDFLSNLTIETTLSEERQKHLLRQISTHCDNQESHHGLYPYGLNIAYFERKGKRYGLVHVAAKNDAEEWKEESKTDWWEGQLASHGSCPSEGNIPSGYVLSIYQPEAPGPYCNSVYNWIIELHEIDILFVLPPPMPLSAKYK